MLTKMWSLKYRGTDRDYKKDQGWSRSVMFLLT